MGERNIEYLEISALRQIQSPLVYFKTMSLTGWLLMAMNVILSIVLPVGILQSAGGVFNTVTNTVLAAITVGCFCVARYGLSKKFAIKASDVSEFFYLYLGSCLYAMNVCIAYIFWIFK